MIFTPPSKEYMLTETVKREGRKAVVVNLLQGEEENGKRHNRLKMGVKQK